MFGGKTITTKKGKKITLLNPSQKGKKFSKELKEGYAMSNSGKYRTDEDGPLPLSNTQKAYRAGYLDARSDNAKCFKHNKKKKQAARKTKKNG